VETLVAYYTLNRTLTHMFKNYVLVDPQPSTVPPQTTTTTTTSASLNQQTRPGKS